MRRTAARRRAHMSRVQRRPAGRGEQPAWEDVAAEVFTGFREWRMQHPQATFKEIESALDERLAQVRVQLLADAVLQSAARDVRDLPTSERPVCPGCGGRLVVAGQEERLLTTTY